MPRKKIKIEKQPLRFLERPAGEARVHHKVPEVRAALNPKDFFTETQGHTGSTLNSWVSPQFDAYAAAVPVKRRRGKLSTSSQGDFTQLSRKHSVCSRRFPPLSFEAKSRHHHQNQRKTVLDYSVSSASNGQGSSHKVNTISNVQKLGTLETGLLQNDDIKSRDGNSKKTAMWCQTRGRPCTSTEDPSSHGSKDCPADITSPLPSLVTPKISKEHSSTFSKPLHLLWSSLCTPSSNREVNVLVPDTPERDYGVKVTWRHRRKLMLLLKERGHLSDSDAVIHA